MTDLHAIIGAYYGLDWVTLVLGVIASFLVTGGRLRLGFSIGILSCIAAFAVASMSGQNGFVVYNVLLIIMNMRGILRGDRRSVHRTNDNKVLTPEAVPVRVHAR